MNSYTHTATNPGSSDADRRNPGAGYPGASRTDAAPRDEERRTFTKIPPPPPDDDDDMPPPPPPKPTGLGVDQSQKKRIPPPPPDDDEDMTPPPVFTGAAAARAEAQESKIPPPASSSKRQPSSDTPTDESCAENNASQEEVKVEAKKSDDPELVEQVSLKAAILMRLANRLCCVPADVGLKQIRLPGETVSKWSRFQAALPTREDMKSWLNDKTKIAGVAVVCGKVSGGLVCLDYDVKNDPSQGEMWKKFILALPSEIAQKLVVESTQSGGKHAFFRMEAEIGNMKLAAMVADRTKVPFETRGEGGYAICAPSRGYVLCQGELKDVLQLDAAEVAEIWMAARAAAIQCGCVWIRDENASKEQGTSTSEKKKAVLTPIDDYNQRGDAVELMKKHGWRIMQEKPDGTIHLTRPGKDAGTSATWNHLGSRRLTVFTTSSEFSTSPSTYGAGAIYAYLECQGDFTKAASELRKSGYGDKTNVNAETTEDSLGPEPEALWSKNDDAAKELPAFDLSLLPSAFRNWVDDISTNMQAPPETPAVAAMVTLSSVAARRLVIQPKVNDPWTEFANLWGLVIGPPSAMKTPAVSQALRPIRSLEKQAASDYDIEMKAYSALPEDLKRVLHDF